MKTKQIAGRLKKSLGRRGALKRHMPLAVMLIAILAAVMANLVFSADTVYDSVSAGNYVDVGLDTSKGISMNLVEKGLTHKVLEFEIASNISAQDIQLLIAENNFDASSGSLAKRRVSTAEQPVYETVCNPYNVEVPENSTIATVQNCTALQTGTRNVDAEEWMPVELKLSEENADSSLATFSILEKGRYRYSFDTPIVKNEKGWGNAGTVFLKVGSGLYADKQHSSWWNASCATRIPIHVIENNGTNIERYPLNVTINTSGWDISEVVVYINDTINNREKQIQGWNWSSFGTSASRLWYYTNKSANSDAYDYIYKDCAGFTAETQNNNMSIYPYLKNSTMMYLPFDEGTGSTSTTQDKSGNGIDFDNWANCNSKTEWIKDAWGNSIGLKFLGDGAGGYYGCYTSAVGALGSEFVIEADVAVGEIVSPYGILFGLAGPGDGVTQTVVLSCNQQGFLVQMKTSGGIQPNLTTTVPCENTKRQHIAMQLKSGVMSLFIDGNLINAAAVSGTITESRSVWVATDGAGTLLNVGSNLTYFDDFRISNSSLNPNNLYPKAIPPNISVYFYENSSSVTESSAREAIVNGISSVLPSATIYTDQQIYARYLNGTQILGTFDKVAVYGSQRWAFNYIAGSDSYTKMLNLTPSLYVWENAILGQYQIQQQVEALITSTRV